MVQPDTVMCFGSYLFALLLGPTWSDINAAAPAGEPIDLQLTIPAGDYVMHKLQWEMTLCDAHPFGDSDNRVVAITRVVADDNQAEQQDASQPLPPCARSFA